MATKTGIELKKTDKGWEAPCGCVFHAFDGLPRVEERLPLSGEIILIGKLAPHWHTCDLHCTPTGRARKMSTDLTEYVKERIQSCVYAQGGAIHYESIIVKNGWLTTDDLRRVCDLYADHLGNWTEIWDEFERQHAQKEGASMTTLRERCIAAARLSDDERDAAMDILDDQELIGLRNVDQAIYAATSRAVTETLRQVVAWLRERAKWYEAWDKADVGDLGLDIAQGLKGSADALASQIEQEAK